MSSSLLKAGDVATKLNISKAQAFLMMRRGDLPVVRMGRLVRVRQEDLDQFVIDQIDQKQTRLSGATVGLVNQIGKR